MRGAATLFAPRGWRCRSSNWARPIKENDLRAFPIMCGNTFTCGGVKITADAEVVNRDGALESLDSMPPARRPASTTPSMWGRLRCFVDWCSAARPVARSALNWVPKEVQRGLGGSHDESRCQRRPQAPSHPPRNCGASRHLVPVRGRSGLCHAQSGVFIPRSSGTFGQGSWIEILRS